MTEAERLADDLDAEFVTGRVSNHTGRKAAAELRRLSAALSEAQLRAKGDALEWAVSRWLDEVSDRPLVNVHRRTLDDTWRQVIRHFGGDPDTLVGPSHDAQINERQCEWRDGIFG